MIDLSILSLPFMQRALVAGVLLALIFGIFGVITLMKKAAFFGETISHAALAGVALGLALGIYPLGAALIYAGLLALILPTLKQRFNLSLDNTLAILLPFSMGLGILIFSLLPGYQPEMMSFLFGSILTIRQVDLWLIGSLFVVSTVVVALFLPKILASVIDPDYARLIGLRVGWWTRVFEVLLAIAIVAGVKLLGVILVNALLIIPASAAKNSAPSLKWWLILSPIMSLITILGGLWAAVAINTPPGATIAVFAGILFSVSGLINYSTRILGRSNPSLTKSS